ncbi:MAG: hypothetical protein M1813_001367 [Trichoglossum hirsutum]|nr:MAG: hypothetical protein M1813_001367 [Trichoglossum hirsutum]
MARKAHRRSDEYELLPRTSSDSTPSFSSLDHGSPTVDHQLLRLFALLFVRLPLRQARAIYSKLSGSRSLRRLLIRGIYWTSAALSCMIVLLVVFTAVFRPSYTHLPDHYRALQRRCLESKELGRGNVNNEKVFIAASLYDPKGTLVGGDWGNAVLGLIELLGPENVYLSIYENDVKPPARAALDALGKKLKCNSSLVAEHLPLEEIPRVTIPSGESRIKRLAFLAVVRNRALRPLEANPSVNFDKLLYINDVMFNPIDAVQLLFSTNVDPSGHAQYGAVCAVDFINAFKFYDRFATRDLEGYTMGIPFFPWFTDAGYAASRQDVLDQKDAVRVRACWGGMTAFEAKWFQSSHPESSSTTSLSSGNDVGYNSSSLRFRYEEDPFWDASECCLIHADLTYLRHGHDITTDSGIFTNPYIRVAYDSNTLRWLPYTRRVERLYSLIHTILNHLVGMPVYNPRRLEQPGDEVVEMVWKYEAEGNSKPRAASGNLKGSYHKVKRIVGPGRFCGSRNLLVLKEDPKEGEKNWMAVPLPKPPR